MFKRVMLCHDGSDHGRRALKRGADLAFHFGAEIHVLAVPRSDVANAVLAAATAGSTCLVDERLDYREMVKQSVERLKARGAVAFGHVAHGNTIHEIVVHARRLAVDLIVVGHYPDAVGRRWWSGPERASLAEQVNCCVFIAVGPDGGDEPVAPKS